ncbi:MAG: IS30 family transposase [Clostridia bacterium]|nr:IS30 family transposase [Clostridia bacterium]
MNNEKKNKHMTLDDRIEIQGCLYRGMSFKAIAKRIGKDPTTVSKEVKSRAKTYYSNFSKTNETCPKLMKAPFVCNGCKKQNHSDCIYPRKKYQAKAAQEEYETVLRECREGIFLNKEEFYKNDAVISEAVKNGQHIYHAVMANKLSVSKSTVYRYIEKGYSSVKKIDLPRAVKFKPRSKKRQEQIPSKLKIGRLYQDFLNYLKENPCAVYQEMDTVIGAVGGKVIMTFQFVNPDFMFGLLLDNKSSAEAAAKVTALKEKLADNNLSFGTVFPVLLTDNGGEFSNVFAFENDLTGCKETSLFFCDPYASYQKPHVENNHTLFRMIVPKGTSFDNFTQETVNTIFSHVNAVKRKQFNGKSAYELFCFTYSAELAELLGIRQIDAHDVMQSPQLLNKILDR